MKKDDMKSQNYINKKISRKVILQHMINLTKYLERNKRVSESNVLCCSQDGITNNLMTNCKNNFHTVIFGTITLLCNCNFLLSIFVFMFMYFKYITDCYNWFETRERERGREEEREQSSKDIIDNPLLRNHPTG